MSLNADDFFKGRFLKASDLAGKPLTLTIAEVSREELDGLQKPIISFEEHDQQLALNKTNLESLVDLTRTKRMSDWVGRRITLVPEHTRFSGTSVDCIRVRPQVAKAELPSEDEVPF